LINLAFSINSLNQPAPRQRQLRLGGFRNRAAAGVIDQHLQMRAVERGERKLYSDLHMA
jgi:hypothetical protein